MILTLFRKKSAPEPVLAVYRAIVAQSRQPRFYADWGVPDTVTGRFDMISLHLALLFRRMSGEGEAARDFSQAVFDLFFKDMDRSLREMGAGDLAVPKKIQKMGSIFFGLLAAVGDALDRGDEEALARVLARNVFDEQTPAGAAPLAGYLSATADRLAAIPVAEIQSGMLEAAA